MQRLLDFAKCVLPDRYFVRVHRIIEAEPIPTVTAAPVLEHIDRVHLSGAVDSEDRSAILRVPKYPFGNSVEISVGGSYKYLRGGPGACWLYVHPRHHRLVTLDTGWFAKKDVFAYQRPEPPQFAAGGDAWLESTPPVLAPFQALAGQELALELGVEPIRQHSLEQKGFLAAQLRRNGIAVQGVGEDHGAFLTIGHADAPRISAELKQRGVKTDARGDYLRLCPDILNAREELERAAATLGALLQPESTAR